jgi:hypothetical protein
MSILSFFRRSSKWLVLATGFACILVGILGIVPHDDEDGRSCLVCKARQESLEALSTAGGVEAPPLRTADCAVTGTSAPRAAVFDSAPPRAPPA